ncbi:MAG: excinuclease ABC subunit UvrC [Patescibacteria group bacterium]
MAQHSENLINQVKALPNVPGVYIYKNAKKQIIYIGKAKNLKKRVGSYFFTKLELGTKTYALVQNICSMEYIEALSELEALILEASLIKTHKPKYNVAQKDDKSYLYIVIVSEKLTKNNKIITLPKVLLARQKDLDDGTIKPQALFGPYPHGDTAKYMLRYIRKLLPFRDCSPSKFSKHQKLNSPCLYGHIGLCQAPCLNNVDVDLYKKDIKSIKRLLSGDSVKLLNDMEKSMQQASKEKRYEEAAHYRDLLKKFAYLRKSFKTADSYVENPYLVEDLITESLEELVNNIPNLNDLPNRIECYDISNISGTDAVGSMVVATGGRLDKSSYRRFKINSKNTPDDFGMLREVLTRRLNRELTTSSNVKKWGFPDLLVIDGGKGQVSTVKSVLDELHLEIPLIGLAKRYETIVYFEQEELCELVLSKRNAGLKLLQKLRDEAHRFAQAYHHKLRLQRIN